MGVGKDTLAAIIQYHTAHKAFLDKGGMPELWVSFEDWCKGTPVPRNDRWVTRQFAGKLKECASLILGVPKANFEDQDFKKETMDPDWWTGDMTTYREFLQLFGTEGCRSVHKNFWINALFSDFGKDDQWIVTDVRFPNEADAILDKGGMLIQVLRTVDTKVGASHSSETAMESYPSYTHTVINNGTLEDLSRQAHSILISEEII